MNGERLRRLGVVGAAWLCAVGGCGGGDAGGGEPRQEIAQLGTPNREVAQLGEQIFDDTSLSEPPGLACASCHDEAHGFADPRGGAVSAGGAAGFRNSPSLAYAMFTPPFSAQSTVGGLNRAIPANRDPAFFDLGLCGPARTDLADSTLCGAFKVPTLRNVAITAPYFHNGQFQTLRELVDFYVTRDTNPERWYPGGNKFDDLPPLYRGNVNTGEVPYDRNPGEAPRLNEDEIDAVVAFLGTLTDGYGGAP
jgi:cytochrome c peroxidase